MSEGVEIASYSCFVIFVASVREGNALVIEGLEVHLNHSRHTGERSAHLGGMAEIFHSVNRRSPRRSIFSLKGQNKALGLGAAASLIATTLVIEVPFLATAFEFEHISLMEYGIAIGLAFLVIPLVEVVKMIQRNL